MSKFTDAYESKIAQLEYLSRNNLIENFKVICDETNNSEEDMRDRVLNITLYIQPKISCFLDDEITKEIIL